MKRIDQLDERIRAALADYVEWEVSQLPSDQEIGKQEFSSKFERKMRRLIASEGKAYGFMVRTAGRRAVSVLIAVMLLTTTMLFSVSATREPIVTFFTEAYEKFTAVFFDKPAELAPYTDGDAVLDEIEIGYIPEGFELKSERNSNDKNDFEYINDNNGYIYISEVSFAGNVIGANTENTVSEQVIINGREGIYYENKGYGTVIWNDDHQRFIVTGTVEKLEILKIAENIFVKI